MLVRLLIALLVMALSFPAVAAETRDTIARENAREGSLDWQLTKVGLRNDVRARGIEGYCSRQSVKAGERIEFFISTDPPARFRL